VIVLLNVKEKTLLFTIGGEQYGAAWSNLPAGKYKLAVDLYNINDEVTVLSEKIEYDHHLLCTLDALSTWKNDLDFSQNAIKQQTKNIDKISVDNLLKDAQYVSQVRNYITIVEKGLQEYQEKLTNYEKTSYSKFETTTKRFS